MGFPEGPFRIRLGVPVGLRLREPFFFVVLPVFASRGVREAFPVPGRLGPFRVSKGNFCYSTKASGEQIFFSERAFDTVYDTVC